jgi:hypothetical protein
MSRSHKQQLIANKQPLTDNKPQQTAKYGKLRSKESGSICLDKAGTGGTGAMVDKPISKKPVQKLESVVQSTNPIGAADKLIAEESGDNWHVAVFVHPVVKSRFSYTLTVGRYVRPNPSPIDEQHPNLFGCFGTPQEAIQAGLEEVEHE